MIHRYDVEVAGQEREVTVEKLDGNRVRVTHAGRARVYEAVRVAGSARASTWSLVPDGGGRQAVVDVDGAAPDLNVTVDNKTVAAQGRKRARQGRRPRRAAAESGRVVGAVADAGQGRQGARRRR